MLNLPMDRIQGVLRESHRVADPNSPRLSHAVRRCGICFQNMEHTWYDIPDIVRDRFLFTMRTALSPAKTEAGEAYLSPRRSFTSRYRMAQERSRTRPGFSSLTYIETISDYVHSQKYRIEIPLGKDATATLMPSLR